MPVFCWFLNLFHHFRAHTCSPTHTQTLTLCGRRKRGTCQADCTHSPSSFSIPSRTQFCFRFFPSQYRLHQTVAMDEVLSIEERCFLRNKCTHRQPKSGNSDFIEKPLKFYSMRNEYQVVEPILHTGYKWKPIDYAPNMSMSTRSINAVFLESLNCVLSLFILFFSPHIQSNPQSSYICTYVYSSYCVQCVCF